MHVACIGGAPAPARSLNSLYIAESGTALRASVRSLRPVLTTPIRSYVQSSTARDGCDRTLRLRAPPLSSTSSSAANFFTQVITENVTVFFFSCVQDTAQHAHSNLSYCHSKTVLVSKGKPSRSYTSSLSVDKGVD